MKGRLLESALVASVLTWVVGSVAHAGSVRVVNGVTGANKTQVTSSLRAVAGQLDVCWRNGPPSAVRVELAVAASGRVTRATQKTRGAAAQCAAGVLAVQSLASTGRGYRVVVELGTAGTASTIQAALKPNVPNLRACYGSVLGAKATAQGALVLRFTIHPDGSVSRPSVRDSTLGQPRVDRCLERAALRMRLPSGIVSKPVGYGLKLSFSGAASSSMTAGAPGAAGGLMPKKTGPLPAAAITQVMTQRKGDFTRCYDRVARRNRALAGHVMLRFTVRDNGTVRNVKIRETTLRSPKVEACIVGVGKTLRFPGEPGRAATKVWYPFSFRTR